MKKRSCRMTAEEKKTHDIAVKIRKMTDAQICELLEKRQEDIDNAWKDGGIHKVTQFLADGDLPLGKGSVTKLIAYAREAGYIA